MAVTTMTVTGKWVNPDGTVPTGRIELTPASTRTINASEIMAMTTFAAVLDATGSISVVLVRCPDGYNVKEFITGQVPVRYPVPDTAGTIDLSTIT